MFAYAKGLLIVALVQVAIAANAEISPKACQYVSENLLQDPRFETLHLPWKQTHWHYSQHSGESSYSYAAQEGTLIFTRTGYEPWANLVQSMKDPDLGGKRIEFSAEVKLNLTIPDGGRPTKSAPGGGLVMTAKKGNRTVVQSIFDHVPSMGVHDWQRLSIIADLPRGTNYLLVGFRHRAGGTIEVRNPMLRVVTTCLATISDK